MPNLQIVTMDWELENLHFATSSLGGSDVDDSGTEEPRADGHQLHPCNSFIFIEHRIHASVHLINYGLLRNKTHFLSSMT